MKHVGTSILTGAAVAVLMSAPPSAQAQSLGDARSYAVLGAQAVTNTGPSVIKGDLGISPKNMSSISGFPPGLVYGTTHAADGVALAAQNSTTALYIFLESQLLPVDLTGQDLGGMTLTPGVYHFSTSAQLTGQLTLDAQGNPDAVFIFQIGSTLTTASGSSVAMSGSGSPCNVFWQVGSSATLGTTTSFAGNIVALTSITLNTGSQMTGRALARNGAVTLHSNSVDGAVCGASVLPGPLPVPALPPWAVIFLMALVAAAGFAAVRRRTA